MAKVAGRGRSARMMRALVRSGIAAFLPGIIARSLRGGLAAAWGRGGTLGGPGVAAANHHSWWDGYLCWLLARRFQLDAGLMMDETQLARFSFFRRLGVIGAGEVREAVRRVRRGGCAFVFPEGALKAAGRVGDLREGAPAIAAPARAPLVPVAPRGAMRGGQAPEALIEIGSPLNAVADRAAATAQLRERLNEMLAGIDTLLAASDPEAAPPGFDRWLAGRIRPDQRASWAERLWRSS
jgi:1-acyl-sn-glycerol-3-phosphate acyltransferase